MRIGSTDSKKGARLSGRGRHIKAGDTHGGSKSGREDRFSPAAGLL